jgi:ferredoxin
MATKILIGHTLAISNTMTVKIEINQEECIQCGKCYNDECPDVFMEGDDGTSMIVEQFRVSGDAAKGQVPDDKFDCATKAAEECPVTVISVSK